MHPQIIALAAAEHVRDMQAQANRGRRARAARRARRGGMIVTAAHNTDLIALAPASEPRSEQPCAPIAAKAA